MRKFVSHFTELYLKLLYTKNKLLIPILTPDILTGADVLNVSFSLAADYHGNHIPFFFVIFLSKYTLISFILCLFLDRIFWGITLNDELGGITLNDVFSK